MRAAGERIQEPPAPPHASARTPNECRRQRVGLTTRVHVPLGAGNQLPWSARFRAEEPNEHSHDTVRLLRTVGELAGDQANRFCTRVRIV